MPMRYRVSVISFTERGWRLSERIRNVLGEWGEVTLFTEPEGGIVRWAGEQFAEKRALVFVGACGIAVRAIAPFVRDKLEDSPVLVLDERGDYVIPILSGHVGGANEIAVRLAEGLGAVAVITTATDLGGRFAADVFAKENHLTILNRDGIAKVSAKVLRGEKITVAVQGYEREIHTMDKRNNQDTQEYQTPEELVFVPYPPERETDIVISTDANFEERAVLKLKPKEYVLGIGCKKGKREEEIDSFVRRRISEIGVELTDIAFIASIERKKEERGICEWACRNRIPYLTFKEGQLQAVEGVFHGSAFVEQTVGVDNVCERAALLACGKDGQLVLCKQAENGMTLAVARRKWTLSRKRENREETRDGNGEEADRESEGKEEGGL